MNLLPRLFKRWCIGTLLMLCAQHEARGQSEPSTQTVTVRGNVYDSLAMKPAAGATVWIRGTTNITTADRYGQFELQDVKKGREFVGFSTAELDSLGLGDLGLNVDIRGDEGWTLSLGTPSFATIWRVLCKNQRIPGADSGVVWGSVRDVANDRHLFGALAEFHWTEHKVTPAKQIEITERSRKVLSDSAGNYMACGMPLATTLISQSVGDRAVSGVLQFTIGERKLTKLDMLVSSEMLGESSRADSAGKSRGPVTNKLRGTSSMRGTVRDEKGRPQAGAQISVLATDSVLRSDADGSFALTNLPSGSQQFTVRKVGFSPTVSTVHLRPGASNEVNLALNSVVELATVDVKAAALANRDRNDYETRRKSGFGYAIDGDRVYGRASMQAVLTQLPNLLVDNNRGALSIRSYSSGRVCTSPKVWLDGMQSSLGEAGMILMNDLVAVEWFPRVINAPQKYAGINSCAVILFWTKQAKWGQSK